MSAHKITVCDVCDQEIREDNGVRKVRYRWGASCERGRGSRTCARRGHEALDRMASLAREVADLLDWADNIAHATRRRDQALRIYWEFPTLATARTRSDGIDWWERYERYQKRVEALLAEFAVLRERP